jgi:Fe2+ or Zn2+ uptake regulation protein
MIPNYEGLDTLRARGLRLTRPRRLILDVVRATDAHPTAAFVYQRVRRRLPRVSLATVYRNLRMLAAEGFLAERTDAGGLRFDSNTGPHDHFTCLTCGRIYDVPARAERSGRRRIAARTGFEVLDHRTEYYVRCGACRRQHGLLRRGRNVGFKKEYYELSLKLAKPLFDALIDAGAPTAATDCPLAALQIEQGTGRKPKHPIEVLASAYGLEE